ncbi:diguanylate cyclase [Paraglaciecola chathamensis]|uniref:diguanylate cyclase n=1 Tax=Paraglaciecola chathamensis TaxID=368405 RepID=A0ABS0WHU8_9ALTE|nr:diguanylate cyclase [Paraglaciecola chathamensis]MBJ2138059.1 diguanylate cyclase [Paraglaciecola chathamensis]|tara:strand:- start:974 stop:2218 length:1245 start_codon:yes stop_codon:yes gene_type:complete
MRPKVLIIDDNEQSVGVIASLIVNAQLTPVRATSLTAAQHIFSRSAPEDFLCAIVDYRLPDAPHGQAIDFTLASFLPTIVTTEFLDSQTRAGILDKDVIDYILKESEQVYEYLSVLLSRLYKNKHIGVLVVDNARVHRARSTALLRRHNFMTYEATTGQHGLEVLTRQSHIKLVIVANDLPGPSGIKMLSEVRQRAKKEDIAVIGLSDRGDTGLSARFIKSGANDFLTQPYGQEEFLCRIMQNIEYIENIELIRRAANSDFLTGLPNRRHFFERAAAALQLIPVCQCLALIDIDHFKKINDTYGHDCGDYTLREIAKLVADTFKQHIPARFGGEEFCVFMPNIQLHTAVQIFNDFRQALTDIEFKFEGQTFHCSVSIGVTAIEHGGISGMLRKADEYLYQAKNNGRNRVEHDPS